MSPTPIPAPTPWCEALPTIACSTDGANVISGCTPDLCAPFPPEPTFNDMAASTSHTLAELAPAPTPWTVDASSVGIGAALTLVVVLAAFLIQRHRKPAVTSPVNVEFEDYEKGKQ